MFHSSANVSFPTDTAKPPDVEKAEVITDYDAKNSDELTVQVGETVELIDQEKDSDGWWKVRIVMIQGCQHDCPAGRSYIYPLNHT